MLTFGENEVKNVLSNQVIKERMDLLFGEDSTVFKMMKRKQNHLSHFSSNSSIKENYLHSNWKHGTKLVEKEQTLETDEEIVREYLAPFIEYGERTVSHIPN